MKRYKIIENNITYVIHEYDNGTKIWYKNCYLHRENGPAIEGFNDYKEWYQNGKLHRDNGPAIECYSGGKEYWYNGKSLKHIKTNKGLKRYIKLLSIS